LNILITFALQIKKNQPMKIKFFILMILFLGIGAASYAQSQSSTTAEKKDAPSAQIVAPEQSKTGECTGHTGTAKAECKWVDANGDGKCDTCGMTEAECKEKCGTAAPKKEGCGASCPMHKSCGEGSTPPKDGKK
jgi:hypothetical protein